MAEHPAADQGLRTDRETPAAHASLREVDLDALVTRQTSTRTRVIQMGIWLTLLLVGGGLIFRGYWAGKPQTPTSSRGTASMHAAILSNVNYGTLTVNGKTIDTHPPVIVTLHAGTNAITLSAPPFRPHTCTFDMSLQIMVHGQCISGSVSRKTTIGGKTASTWIDVPLLLADLPADHQHSVAALVAQAIDGIAVQTTVPAHQYIAIGLDTQDHPISRQTDEELQADVTLVRQAGQYDPYCSGNSGASICAAAATPYNLPGLPNPSGTAATVWKIATFVVPHWHFTTRTGDTVAASPLSDASGSEIDLPFHYDVAHGWRLWGPPVAPGPSGAVDGALDIMANAQCSAGMTAVSAYVTPSEPTMQSLLPHGIEGCQVTLGSPSTATSLGRFIWRFGVLLAADPAAHKLVPSLPVAPQAEIDAVTT